MGGNRNDGQHLITPPSSDSIPSNDPTVTKRASDWISCYSNMTNTIIGAGILGLPYAYSESGFIAASLFMIISMCLSLLGSHLLSKVAFKIGTPCTLNSALVPLQLLQFVQFI